MSKSQSYLNRTELMKSSQVNDVDRSGSLTLGVFRNTLQGAS